MFFRTALPVVGTLLLGVIVNCGASDREAQTAAPAASEKDAGEPTVDGAPASSVFTDAAGSDAPASSECTEDIDVVLALDVSSSMDFVLDKLDAEFDKVVQASNKLKSGAHFGLVLFVDNVKVDTTGDQSGGKVHTAATTLTAAFRDAKQTYTIPNRNPGDGPTGPDTQNPICEENSLDALHDAVTEFPWRDNTARVVIMVTDDTFIEKPDNYGDRDHDGQTDKTDFPREGNYPARFDVAETTKALRDAKIRVFSFTKLTPPDIFSACGTPRRFTAPDANTWGWSKKYQGHAPFPDITGGKNYDLDAIRSGSASLADTINEIVLQTHCAGPPK